MTNRNLNFVEGQGISIQFADNLPLDATDVEIANNAGGQLEQKGDLVAGTGTDPIAARLPVGDDRQVLTADSTTGTGLAWADSTGGTTPADTAGWMPLTTVVGGTPELVWDADNNLIPTYGTF